MPEVNRAGLSRIALGVIAPFALLAGGCAQVSPQRVGFETLANVGRAQCLKDPGAARATGCARGQGYDDYQRSRRQAPADR
jgi:hypothetical protein